MTYKNAGIGLREDEIEMLDALAKREHLVSRSALVRRWLYQAWERIYGAPNPDVSVVEAVRACPSALMDQEQG